MRRVALGAAAIAILAGAAAWAEDAPAPVAASAPPTPTRPAPKARPQPFAAALSMQAMPAGPAAWSGRSAARWIEIAALGSANRQAARWALARSLIGEARGAEALGVLDVMRQDDPDLALVPAWRLAHAVAEGAAGHWDDAASSLGDAALSQNAEACAWRLRAAAATGRPDEALAEAACARPALVARTKPQRRPFALAAAGAAIATGRSGDAVTWLRGLAADDADASLLRAEAALRLGQGAALLERLAADGAPAHRAAARLALVEAGISSGATSREKARAELAQLRFIWRGGDIERRALQLDYRLAAEAKDMRAALAAGATLMRYFPPDENSLPMLSALQTTLETLVAPDSALPVEQAAGLYWDYRDLSPAGVAGDRLVGRLADRLQIAGLYARAGELLQYQLTARVRDIAQGPLSVKVATLAILAGFPDRALRAIRDTDGNLYPPEMIWERHRIEAVALHQLGKTDEALAALQDVPDGNLVRAEIFWKTRDWAELVSATGPALPPPGALSDVAQAIVLRHAIALAMLGREADLARLRTRYAASFARLPTAATFDVLTHAIGSIDPTAVSRAMAALPSASPAGAIGDLLDVSRAAAPVAAAPATAPKGRRSS